MEKKIDEKILEEFRKRKRRQMIAVTPLIIAMVSLVMFGQPNQPGSRTIVWICMGLMTVVFGFTFYNWRCPSCNGYLGKNSRQKFCPKCGVQLRDK